MNTDLQSILKLVLPEFLVDNFEITKIEESSSRIELYLEENKTLPQEFISGSFILHGFHKQIKIKDFPMRGKQVNLNIKRRRWLNKKTNEVISTDWKLIAKGTRMTDEFASFLKELN
ncbi:MAG: transposase [Crocinitomix sp.]|nr:transposase [Crocinitomix sp.]